MKKLLALFIAALMLITGAVAVSAGSYPFLPDSQEVSTEYTLSYYKWLYYTKGAGAVNESIFAPDQTAWLSPCPECEHQMYNIVRDGKVIYFCPNCDNGGTYPLLITQIPRYTYGDPEEGVVCTNCGSDNIIYASTTYTSNKLVDNFVCGNCKKAFTKDSVFGLEYYVPGYGFVAPNVYPDGSIAEPYYFGNFGFCPECRKPLAFKSYKLIGDRYYAYLECADGHPSIVPVELFDKESWPTFPLPVDDKPYTIPTGQDNPGQLPKDYKCSVCSKALAFKYYVQYGDVVYARYECENGHPVLLPASVVDTVPASEKVYLVNIETVGSGYYRIADNRPFGKSGEKKTVTFTAKNGYQLADVTVNGKSYGAKAAIEFTLKSDMNITATFIRTGETYTPGTNQGGTGTGANPPVSSTTGEHAIAVVINGKGTATAKKNNVNVEPGIVRADKKDTVVYTFTGKNSHYVVKDVKLDGKSIGAVSTYTIKNITTAHILEVEFEWKSPFSYIAPGYEEAVEYVTEAGILEPTAVTNKVSYFSGTNVVSIKAFACALAEMQDVDDALKTEEAREQWAIANGLIGKDEKTTKACDIQTACRITEKYLRVVEKKSGVSFLNLDEKLSTEQNGINIGLVSHEAYEVNRQITRYDIAAVCYLILRLPLVEK